MKKRLLPIILLGTLGVTALVGCGQGGGGGETTVKATGVSLNKSTLTLNKGATETLVATVAPENATNKNVTWSSADKKIATVDENGLVSAVELGTTEVTVTTVDGGFTAKCTVTVDMTITSLSITNKDEFKDGLLVEASKTLKLSSDPAVNMNTMSSKGYLKITSSDTTVATISGLNVYAAGAGKTTIKAELFGASDEFELTVSAKPTNKERFGTDHEGDATDPFTNEDALKVAAVLEKEGWGTEDYYVRGEVASFYHAPGSRDDKTCSWYLKPATEDGKRFEAYKISKADGTQWTNDDIWVGAIATFHGKFAVYNGQYETSAGVLDKVEGEKPEPQKEIAATVAEALAVGKALEDGNSTYDIYVVTGYVAAKDTQGNKYLHDTKDGAPTLSGMIEIYGAEDAVLAQLLYGAKVTIKMQLKNYHGQIENTAKVKEADFTLVEAGQAEWPAETVTEATVAQALAVIDSIEVGATTVKKYAVTGYITKVTTDYSSQYHNISFNLGDTEDAETVLGVYRGTTTDELAPKLIKGAQVKVTGLLNNNSHGKQIAQGATIELLKESQGGGEEDKPIVVTVAQALELINALETPTSAGSVYVNDGAKYEITGVVTKIGTWSDQYGNGDLYIADTAGDTTNTLQLYRVNIPAVFFAAVVDQTVVKVTAPICGYFRNNSGTITLSARETAQNPNVEIVSGGKDLSLTGIDLGDDFELEAGKTKQLTATLEPKGATAEITWSVEGNEKVTCVDGLVTVAEDAVVGSTATIKATSGEVVGSVVVTVKEAAQPGEEAIITFDATTQGYTNQQEVASWSDADSKVTISFAKGSNNNAPKYYTTGTAVRCYGGNTITVTAASGNVVSVVFTFASGEGSNAISADSGEFVSPNWTGEASPVVFTIGGTSGHRRIVSMVITIR